MIFVLAGLRISGSKGSFVLSSCFVITSLGAASARCKPSSTAAAVDTDGHFLKNLLACIAWGEPFLKFNQSNCQFNVSVRITRQALDYFPLVKATFLQVDGDGLITRVDLGIYSMSALLRVAYRFTDRCYLHLERDGFSVYVRFRAKASAPPLDQIAGEFCNELLDQTLREIVAQESEPVRNLVLAHALSRTSFVDSERESNSTSQ